MTSKSQSVSMANGLQELVESRFFSTFIIAVIVINAITLGLETSPTVVGLNWAIAARDRFSCFVDIHY